MDSGTLQSITMEPTVVIVDDDSRSRDKLARLVRSNHLRAESYASLERFFKGFQHDRSGCLILNVYFSGVEVLQLLRALMTQKISIPVIVCTVRSTVTVTAEVLQRVPIEFFEEAQEGAELLTRVQHAIALDESNRRIRQQVNDLSNRFDSLSRREWEILEHLADGKHPKRIARDLGISPTTVDFHRRNIWKKLRVDSNFELGRAFGAYQQWQIDQNHP